MSANSPFLTLSPSLYASSLSYLPCLVTDIQFQLQIIAQRLFFLFLSIKKSNAERGRKWKKEEKKSNKFLANRIDRKESRSIEREREGAQARGNNPKIHPSSWKLRAGNLRRRVMDEVPLVPTILGQEPCRYRVAGILRDYVVASRLTSLSLCHDEWKTNGSTLICLGRGAISNPSFSRRVAREIESEQTTTRRTWGKIDRSIYRKPGAKT